MACKNCVHYYPCKEWLDDVNVDVDKVDSTDCKYFWNRFRIVKLPSCKIGDTIYFINSGYFGTHIASAKIEYTGIYDNDIVFFCHGFRFFQKDIGNKVFLTVKEAQKTLEQERQLLERMNG